MCHTGSLHHLRRVGCNRLTCDHITNICVYRAKLDGCILGKNTKVGTKAELSRCVTQAGYEVDAGGNFIVILTRGNGVNDSFSETYRNEKLDVSDWTAPQGSSSEDEETETDDSEES